MDAAHTPAPGPDEQQVELRLRMLLGVLNRQLNRLYLVMGEAWVFAAPVSVCVLVEVWRWAWWTALLGGVAGSAALLVHLGVLVEAGLARRSARAFNRQFPEATPERAQALSMLAEMRTFRAKAESALSNALAAVSPADAVVRHKVDPEGGVHAALQTLTGIPAAPPPQPAPAATEPAPPARPRAGVYDYIPLEPRAAGEDGAAPLPKEEPPAYPPLEIREPPPERKAD